MGAMLRDASPKSVDPAVRRPAREHLRGDRISGREAAAVRQRHQLDRAGESGRRQAHAGDRHRKQPAQGRPGRDAMAGHVRSRSRLHPLFRRQQDAQVPNPAAAKGNRMLLEQFELHAAADPWSRRRAVPLIFFRRIAVGRKAEGLSAVPRDSGSSAVPSSSSNSTSRSTVLELRVRVHRAEPRARARGVRLGVDQPAARPGRLDDSRRRSRRRWRGARWVETRGRAPPRVRRDVQRLRVRKRVDQLPPGGSRGARLLQELHKHYQGKGATVRAVAAWITERRLGGRWHLSPSRSDTSIGTAVSTSSGRSNWARVRIRATRRARTGEVRGSEDADERRSRRTDGGSAPPRLGRGVRHDELLLCLHAGGDPRGQVSDPPDRRASGGGGAGGVSHRARY